MEKFLKTGIFVKVKHNEKILKGVIVNNTIVYQNGKMDALFDADIIKIYDCCCFDLMTPNFLVWEREPILTNEEKEYLSFVIKPFRSRVKEIKRERIELNEYICISITTKENYRTITASLPILDTNKMYKNWEVYKEYTLEDLGL